MAWLPYPSNISSVTDVFQYADTVTCTDRIDAAAIANCAAGGGYFGIFILIGIFAFLFIGLKGYRSEEAFTVASFFTMLSSFFLFILELVPEVAVAITTIMFTGSIFLLRRQ